MLRGFLQQTCGCVAVSLTPNEAVEKHRASLSRQCASCEEKSTKK